MLSTLKIHVSLFPPSILQVKKEKLVIFTRDVTKALIRSLLSKRLILYQHPREFFVAYPQFIDHLWRGLILINGELEAGLYWRHTLVPWLMKNIPDLQQYIFDPSLLFSQTKLMAIIFCTDNIFVVMPESMLRRSHH